MKTKSKRRRLIPKLPPVYTMFTGCCALSQLKVTEKVEAEEIDKVVASHAEEVDRYHAPGSEFGGAPQLFCVTTPDEAWLDAYLDSRRWRLIDTMSRRVGYPGGRLHLWMKRFLEV